MKFKELRKQIDEATGLDIRRDPVPAMVLVLKRRGMRIFPDGSRVALYVNDRYNMVFTVPFGNLSFGSAPKDNSTALISGVTSK